MQHVAAAFYTWLQVHNIDPEKVKLIIRADDDQILCQVSVAVLHELHPLDYYDKRHTDLRGLMLNGVGISFSSLDQK